MLSFWGSESAGLYDNVTNGAHVDLHVALDSTIFFLELDMIF